ncbi:uncharacterized protein LOC103310889, partial [Acyrthosiphon pisum]
MSFCVRYVDEDPEHQLILREDFLKFVSVENTTGKNIANVIFETIKCLGIDSNYMVGQGYDGAASMSGNFNGVQAIIRKVHPTALYVHCSAHSLNLALSHSCSIQHIRNCIGTIKSFPESKWTKLTSMCKTRWVENHDGLIRFTEIYKAIVNTLDDLQLKCDIETSSKALQLGKTIITSDFVIKYYRITIAIPFFDDFIEQLQARFNNHKKQISSLHKLLPKICNKIEIDANDFEIYSEFLDIEVLLTEIQLWKRKWSNKPEKEQPNSAIEAYIK